MDKSDIEAIIQKAQVCRVAMADGGQPYVVAVCFGYRDDVLYFHCGLRGRKLDVLRRNDRVCVQFDVDTEVVPHDLPCKFSFRYRSAIAFGRAVIVEDPAEKLEGLNVIMRHYTGRDWEFPADKVARTAVVRIEIESMTGKSAGF